MKSNDVRQSFLDYFATRGHKVVASSPLIPQNDPTLLFTNAGMNQFKNVFLGQEKRDYKTATSSQKCLRAGGKHNDLENVGFTARHHTFFEMLGNFSFGDYFKAEAIAYAWEYITKTLGLDPSRLYATVFTDDDEAERLWKKIAPELGDRVLRFGEHDNFWSMGETGPCGPCSEIHYDRGPQYPGELNGDGDRFMEIWNLVFMQYNRDENRVLTPLPKPSVDTGAGLERFCMVLQNTTSNYETDLFEGLLAKVSELSRKEYSLGPDGVSHRVISDHVRALTFAIADGGIISNEGRGYVLRRILRRAARHGRLLGLHEPFLYKVVQPLVEKMGGHFAEIGAKQSHIELVIRSEEEQFGRTLDTGLEIFDLIIKKADFRGQKVIPGFEVFRLYDTFGFPVDLTEIMAKEKGFSIDLEGFETELARQRERSKATSKFEFSDSAVARLSFDRSKSSKFVGYNKSQVTTTLIDSIFDNGEWKVILEETPFYAESGGQIGDTGVIEPDGISLNSPISFEFCVTDTQNVHGDIVHIGKFKKFPNLVTDEEGTTFVPSYKVIAHIDHDRRTDIRRNHTATHLLHKALRMVLGEHVHQAGSLVAPDRLRFDFTHFKSMTPQELDKVEKIVNQKIQDDLEVNTFPDMPLDEAKKMGAMALFGEKYGDKVRVVKTGEFSLELCGGTHVSNTGDIEHFFITQEAAIAAGMRRIEAITGSEAAHFLAEQESMIAEIKGIIKKDIAKLSEEEISRFKFLVNSAHRRALQKENLLGAIENFVDKVEKHLKKQEREAQGKLAESATAIEPKAVLADGKVVIYIVSSGDARELMVFADSFKKAHPQAAVLTVSSGNGGFAITSDDPALGKDVFAEVVAVSGGRGGGQGTIRGSMPTDKIDAVVEALKGKYA